MTAIGEQEEFDFTLEEWELYASFIPKLTPKEFHELIRISQWQQAGKDHILITEDQTVDRILFISEGRASESSKGDTIHEKIEAGSFVGEMELLVGGLEVATLTTATPIRYIVWQRNALEQLLASNPEMGYTSKPCSVLTWLENYESRVPAPTNRPARNKHSNNCLVSSLYTNSVQKTKEAED
ncbi:cyclic nucleotide-binding domain-containing protein [Chloroflexota bacterium]